VSTVVGRSIRRVVATRRRSRAGGVMTLTGHLSEFRRRVTIAIVGVLVGAVVGFAITDSLIEILTAPIRDIAQTSGDTSVALSYFSVTAAFDLRMRIAILAGFLLSAPVWIWQAWAFVTPGLTRKEVRYTVGFTAVAGALFLGGCAAGLAVVPHVIELMSSFVPEGGAQFYDSSYYYDFVLKLIVVTGIAFLFPIFLVALNFAGVLSGVGILRGWRFAIVAAATFAALATPAADLVSMAMLSGILIVLYMLAAVVALVADRRRNRSASLPATERRGDSAIQGAH
jgi:sec-independent protein translocase protein TatC